MDPNLEALGHLYARIPFLVQRLDQVTAALFALHHGQRSTPTQFHSLAVLHSRGPMMQVDLARLMGADKSTIGLVVTNLLKHHLIARTVDENDRRRKLVSLTEKGKDFLHAGRESLQNAERALMAPLSEMQWEQLSFLLNKLAPQAPTSEPLSWVHNRPTWLARRCLQSIESRLSGETGLFGLTLRQYAVLYIVFCHPGISESQARRFLGYETSNITLVANILADKAMIERGQTARFSRKCYRVSKLGADVLRTIEPRLRTIEFEWLSGMSEQEKCTLIELLCKLVVAHADKVKAPIEPLEEVSRIPTWPASCISSYIFVE
ncbi:MarR family transcriptional regulator [Pseudomonas sp. LS1212]|uniref:MarR family transcriptional regulator n=1 Tax=Pseudomonas sp. LS1212 TaxID=2972478 RepID=UPI00215CCDCD|nr:MarR family transcriptional regulator [Pseudomonas sp. LS1212]UVJ45736.1 MarR family transcriptional regulator [Pseudomonas sp. LS1212]